MSFFWLLISYLLGSLPFGYIISKISGKNVLKIGWRKTSGSNVFKNVGKYQGILTGLLDILKGYLAVYGAQRLGFSSEIQILSGVAAVVGHNWSVFLRFSGGRGIATFGGALLGFSFRIFLLSIIPLIALGLIWNLAIGTILFLATVIFLSKQYGQFETTGLLAVLSLIPISIKRLSPIGEIKKAQNKAVLIRNRLIFDDDITRFDLRIKRILPSLLVPPKLGWKAAKFGVKMAKKPIKFILKNHEKVVTEISIEDFKKMMLAATKKIVLHQEEINRINVFPVADKDTGYNLAATLLGIEGTISQKSYPTMRELARDIREAAMINARGNAGMIYTGYIIEVLERIKHLEKINAFQMALAMRSGIRAARESIAQPVEGTILDAIGAAGSKAYETAKFKRERNIIKVLEEARKVTEVALKETKEKLQVLKENDVVDAGALGYLKIIEAWMESLEGVPVASKVETAEPIVQPAIGELKNRYEVVLSFKKGPEIKVENLKEGLSTLGDSLEIIASEDKIKLHIHTDQPEVIREMFNGFSDFECLIEDMEKQIKEIKKKPLGLVVDAISDLPEEFLEKYGILEVPFATRFPNGEVIVSKEEIYPKMKAAIQKGEKLPTTSAPSFREFLLAYQRGLEKFEKILVITVCSKLSGAYSSARIARSIFKKPTKLDIFVFDCFSAEVAEGLIVMKAQELINQGKTMKETVDVLKTFCPRVNLLASLQDFRYMAHGGRIRLPQILVKAVSLFQKMGIKLIIGLKNGKIRLSKIRFGKDTVKILVEEIKREKGKSKMRVAIAHADDLKEAGELEEELKRIAGLEIVFISSVSPAVGIHTGPGALLVAFHPVDI